MAKAKIIDSFNYAIEGFIHVLKSQRNMRVHFLFAVFVLLLGVYINLSKIELLLLLTTITIVLSAEIFNTAVEYTVDLISRDVTPKARIIKDVGAGAVLLSVINAVIAGYIIFSQHLNVPFEYMLIKVRNSSWHITFISLIVVFSIVIAGKLILQSGTPLRGGMPSGHSALAFSIWTCISFFTTNNLVVILTFILAFLVAKSRVAKGIHSGWEVLSGAIIGVLATTLVFQVLK